MNYLFILVLCPALLVTGGKRHSSESDSTDRQSSGSGYSERVKYSAHIDRSNGASKHVGFVGKDGKITGAYKYEIPGTQGTSQGGSGGESSDGHSGHFSKDGKISGVYHYEVHGAQGSSQGGISDGSDSHDGHSGAEHVGKDGKITGYYHYEVHGIRGASQHGNSGEYSSDGTHTQDGQSGSGHDGKDASIRGTYHYEVHGTRGSSHGTSSEAYSNEETNTHGDQSGSRYISGGRSRHIRNKDTSYTAQGGKQGSYLYEAHGTSGSSVGKRNSGSSYSSDGNYEAVGGGFSSEEIHSASEKQTRGTGYSGNEQYQHDEHYQNDGQNFDEHHGEGSQGSEHDRKYGGTGYTSTIRNSRTGHTSGPIYGTRSTQHTSNANTDYTSGTQTVYTQGPGRTYKTGHGNEYISGSGEYGSGYGSGYSSGNSDSYGSNRRTDYHSQYGTGYDSNHGTSSGSDSGTRYGSGTGYDHTSGTGYTRGTRYTSGPYTTGTGQYSTRNTGGSSINDDVSTRQASDSTHTAHTRHTKGSRRTTTEKEHSQQTTPRYSHHTRRPTTTKTTTERISNTRRTTQRTHHERTTTESSQRRTSKYHHHEQSTGSSSGGCSCKNFELAYQWSYFNFTWNCPMKLSQMKYSPVDYIPLSIAIYNHSVYMTFPRLRNNARITLARMPLHSPKMNPVLTPFPSWDMNNGLTCESFQDVTAVEIDKDGIMWVLDGRRLHPKVNCPAKLYLIDLKQDGKIIKRYNIPETICQKTGCLLNDIVVDKDYAFISDLSAGDEGVIVYNRRRNRSWKARARGHEETFHYRHRHDNCNPNLFKGDRSRAVAWIALSSACSSKNRTFTYIPEELPHAFGLSVDVLKNERTASGDLSQHVFQMFSKQGASGAAIYDSRNNLYVGLLSQRTIGIMKAGEKELTVCPKSNMIRYPGTFAFDNENSTLYMMEMSSLNFASTGVNVRQLNFRLLKMKTESKGYMYCSSGRH